MGRRPLAQRGGGARGLGAVVERDDTQQLEGDMDNNAAPIDPAITAFADLMPEGTSPLERADILRHPFPLVDAALEEFLITQRQLPQVTARRQQVSSGSARYLLQLADPKAMLKIAIIRVRMVGENATHIVITPTSFSQPIPGELLEGYLEVLHGWLAIFIYWLTEEQVRVAKFLKDQHAAREAMLTALPPDPQKVQAYFAALRSARTQSKRGGPYSWPEDDWAWEQVNTLSRPRREVRKEWEQRLSPDRPPLQDIDRSFRHAVNPKRKPETPET